MNLKRFLVFVVVCITAVSLGLTTYYFLRDEERIFAESAVLYLNVGDTFEVNYEHINPRFGTEVNIEIQDENVAQKDPVTEKYVAVSGGKTIITITSNKSNFRSVAIEINVGDGSFTTPFYVQSAQDLESIGISAYRSLDKNYVLTQDISLASMNWIPLGNESSTGFTGVFDFNFKTISNFKMNLSVENGGLFSKIGKGGVVKNLIMSDVEIIAESLNVGAVAGICEGTIERTAVTSAQIKNNGTVAQSNVGGLVGKLISTTENYSVVDRCSVIASVSGYYNVGGIIGYNDGGQLINSFSSKNFNATTGTWGVVGLDANTSICGGLIGTNAFSSAINTLNAPVINCYSTMLITSNTASTGALIGKNIDRNSADNNINYLFGLYFASDLSNVSNGVALVENGYTEARQIVALTSDELKIKTNFDSYKTKENVVTTWDFDNVWQRNSEILNGYPSLKMKGANSINDLSQTKIGNQIWNINDLNELRNSNEKWILMEDLDLSSITNFTPIGTIENPFSGTLNGNGHKIYNLTTQTTTQYTVGETSVNNEYYGLFGVIGQNAKVYNLTLENVNISVGTNVGALAGMNLGTIDNCTLIGSAEKTSKLSSSYCTGALVGLNSNTITNSSVNFVEISGTTIANKNLLLGGIVGKNTNNGFVINSKVKADASILTSSTGILLRAGGIAGENNNKISKCYFAGTITADSSSNELTVGGIAGANYNKELTRVAYSSASQTTLEYRRTQDCEIEYCLSAGTIVGYRAGGLVGLNSGDIKESQSNAIVKGVEVGGLVATMNEGTIMDCYANCDLQGATAKSVKAGIVHFAYSYQFKFAEKATLASCVLNCFSTSNFDDVGTNYRETATTMYNPDINSTGFQFTDGYWINNLNDSDVASNAKQAERWLFLKKVEQTLTTQECIGDVENFKAFINSDFRSTIWTFTVGKYPVLKNVATA